MAAFEYGSGAGSGRRREDDPEARRDTPREALREECPDPRRLREEPVIAMKVYDQCRCLFCHIRQQWFAHRLLRFQKAAVPGIDKTVVGCRFIPVDFCQVVCYADYNAVL